MKVVLTLAAAMLMLGWALICPSALTSVCEVTNNIDLMGGAANQMCVSSSNCSTTCAISGSQCAKCNGSIFVHCKASSRESDNCVQTFGNPPKTCGTFATGNQVAGQCPAAALSLIHI